MAAIRWLLVKDLQLLRRSPLLTALLVVYPIAIAVLIGFALSAGPDKPRIAFLNQIPEEDTFELGGEEFDVVGAKGELCERLECIDVGSREEAVGLVESGEVLGALILPPDLVDKLRSLGGLTPARPVVEVLVNEEDPVKGQLVDDRIEALLAEANLRLSEAISAISTQYLTILLEGGNFGFLADDFDILGLRRSSEILREVSAGLDPSDPRREALAEVVEFADLASDNLDIADDLLGSVSQPIEVEKQVISGSAPGLDEFAIAVAATVTLMFVTVLLVAGSLALEREENAYARLTRGLIGKTALLGEKVLLGIGVSLAVTLLMLAGLELFVSLEWGRFPLWVPAILAAAAAFAAFGAAIGVTAREVRASSLLAFMVSLPIAFLSLIPSGTVGAGLYDAIEVFAAAFPFDPALRALGGALDETGPSVLAALGHLAALALVYGAVARIALRRFG